MVLELNEHLVLQRRQKKRKMERLTQAEENRDRT